MMRIRLTDPAFRQYQKLALSMKRKTDKQFEYLISDIRHPSLHAKKYKEDKDLWQARIDKDWRFYFYIIAPDYIIVSVIKHPK